MDGYVAQTGKPRAEIVDWMKAETWFSAAEAVEAGFADATIATTAAKAEARAFNLAPYANAPKALTETPADEPEQMIACRDQMLARMSLYERNAA